MSTPVLVQRFDRERELARGPHEERRQALDEFLAHGFPTRRDEAWRYTDLRPIAEGDFDVPPVESSAETRARASALLDDVGSLDSDAAAARIVLIDGRVDEPLSRLGAVAGLALKQSSAEPLRRAEVPRHPLAILNYAFARDEIAVQVEDDAAIDKPLEIFLVASGDGRIAQHPRVAIELGRRARLDVIVHCIDAADTEGWLNAVVDVTLGDGSRLAIHRLQEHGPRFHHTSLLTGRIGRNANLVAGYADLGARLARNDVAVQLAAPGAHAEIFGVFVAAPGRQVDNQIDIDHAAPHTTSDTAFRGIADRTGRGVFRGKILVQRDAQKIEAHQKSDNLLVADQAEINTRPELEIYADDVKCSHGATVGEIDPEHLFYLRCRGLDEESARALLSFAFARRLLERLAPAKLRERATRLVAGQLPAPPAWEEME